MEQKHVNSLGCGCLIGLVIGWIGMLFYIGCQFAEGCRQHNPNATIEKATLQQVEIDGNIPDSMNLYLLSIFKKDTSTVEVTDIRYLDSVYVTDRNGKRIESRFRDLKKLNEREFTSMEIESPLLFHKYEIEKDGEGIFEGQGAYLTRGDHEIHWLFLLSKKCTLPRQLTFKFERAEIRGEVINTPLKCNIMSIDYTELPKIQNEKNEK